MKVVVVESPAKAKTINKYLGSDYKVVASYGHVRDLPAKDGSVLPEADFAMSWEVDGKSEKHLKPILEAARGADRLFLATDPDREGEAISWHVREVLNSRRGLKGLDVKRVVFNEVTRNAVLDAFTRPRDIDRELVEAYLARRALDYLVGFTLSPVLWRKLPGSRSAGRVQSVALRLICEREAEIEVFKPREYWTIEVEFRTEAGQTFTARLTHLDGKRLDRFDLDTEAKARAAADAILRASGFAVSEIESRQVRRNPFPPFTTSTLQQEASRKLGLSANRTMQIAQRLYEGIDLAGETVGLITYMRTDGVAISAEAIAAARQLIGGEFGARYVPDAPRVYRSPAKNAQEAHEAVRPTDLARKPDDVARYLDREQLRLYELIWKRTVASQMASALLEQVAVDIADSAGRLRLRANGSIILFDGFLALYQEDRDDAADEEGEGGRLPAMRKAERLARGAATPSQHFTQPPPRYTEASLVKKLEELGIGRPSTYASILQVLQDRDYVRLEKRRFVPEDRGRLVTAFLTNFFERYVEYNFTADLENQLDDISGGRIDWKEVLRNFWRDFSAAVDGTKDLTISQVLTALDEALGRHFFPTDGTGNDPRLCPNCGSGRLSLKLGKFGAFIGCSNYPNCRYTRPLAVEADAESIAPETALGTDPGTGLTVTLKKGPYGHYVQLGEGNGEFKPKRVALPRPLKPAEVNLEMALQLLALPRELGRHPETGEAIVAGIGRFGAYLKHGAAFKSLGADDDVLTIGLNRAVVLLAEPSPAQRRGPQLLRELGAHPEGGAVGLYRGRYGPYVSHGGVIASLPRNADPDTFSLADALPLLAAQRDKGKKRGRKAAKSASNKAKAANGATGERPAAKRSGATKKTARRKAVPTKTGANRSTAKTPRAQPGSASR
ncbi:MAG: type I DNA topoisomerase [Alphaproteobacteria bacterium]|nr:type I DNA topoisomerase [Alphaproteobacteria bacterium]MBV9378414.1 type I DNA topoisomerase [Alphaproteobacteria bacterium]